MVKLILKNIGAKIAAALTIITMLTSCGGLGPNLTTATGVTAAFIMTDKLPTDMIAEATTGLDCSYLRHLEDKGPVCRSQDYGQVIEKPVYCYKSLGRTDCYDYPDPYGNGARAIQ